MVIKPGPHRFGLRNNAREVLAYTFAKHLTSYQTLAIPLVN